MNAYFDTSAFLKLLIREPGSIRARAAWERAEQMYSGRLSYAEARAALAAACRQGRVRLPDVEQTRRDLERAWSEMEAWDAGERVVRHAGDLAEQHELRGYDAVHLATALASGAELFVTADIDLIRSGVACGLRVLDTRADASGGGDDPPGELAGGGLLDEDGDHVAQP